MQVPCQTLALDGPHGSEVLPPFMAHASGGNPKRIWPASQHHQGIGREGPTGHVPVLAFRAKERSRKEGVNYPQSQE